MGLLKWIEDLMRALGGMTSLLVRALGRAIRTKPDHLWLHAEELGFDAWPIVVVTAYFTGAVLALQTGIAFVDIGMRGATVYIPMIVSKSMILELGPVFTAIILAGRSGAGIGAQIGSMNVSEQVNALRALAIDPVTYLVSPRLIAFAVAVPALTILADMAGSVGGLTYCWLKLDMPSGVYVRHTLESLWLRDFLTSEFKSMVWGLSIALVGCYQGLTARRGVIGVGQATRNTVVYSILLILISDFFLTRVFRLIVNPFFSP